MAKTFTLKACYMHLSQLKCYITQVFDIIEISSGTKITKTRKHHNDDYSNYHTTQHYYSHTLHEGTQLMSSFVFYPKFTENLFQEGQSAEQAPEQEKPRLQQNFHVAFFRALAELPLAKVKF